MRQARPLAYGLLLLGLLTAPSIVTPERTLAASSGQVRLSADNIRAALAAELAIVRTQLPDSEGRDLANLYELTQGRAAWLSPDGTPGASVREAIAMLVSAETDGLDPTDYDVRDITSRLSVFPATSPGMAAGLDVRLTAAVLRFYRHLHFGRADPRESGRSLRWPIDRHDMAAFLHTAIRDGRIAERARELAPALAQYALLREQLIRYRQLATQVSGGVRFTATVRLGDASTSLASLHRLLVTVGDQPRDAPVADGIYDEALAAGVRRFQTRHGLDADGVIGPATQAALAVPLGWRVRQFELALERLRWLPDLTAGRVIAVNIPTFRLFAWNRVPSTDAPALSMKVVVGRAMRTETPVFADQMEYLIFRPYWNVPAPILHSESLPAIKRDPTYLARQAMEIVDGDSDHSPVLPATPDNIARLGQAGVRLRQRPGARNALGLLKFMFPNVDSIYMHDTPATELFARSRRDFSHGCIRVEDPERLAEWVLSDIPGWRRESIRAAMQGAPNRRVDLPQPIQVVIFYTTVIVQPDDGAVHFAGDIYGHDTSLDKAM